MRKNLTLFGLALAFILVFGIRIYVLIVAGWDYFNTKEVCLASQTPSVMGILEVKPYTVITDHGNMYIGDEYIAAGEGAWYGNAALLWTGQKGAIFIAEYGVDDPIKGYSRHYCRWFVPAGDYHSK